MEIIIMLFIGLSNLWRVETCNETIRLLGNDIARELVEIYPDAAKVQDSNGSLPLHLSLYAGKKWFNDGIKELFEAAPEALSFRDHQGLTPVMIAASVEGCDLTTIFQLLRNGPCSH